MDNGADMEMAIMEPSERRIPEPNAIQIQADITRFSRRFEAPPVSLILLGVMGFEYQHY